MGDFYSISVVANFKCFSTHVFVLSFHLTEYLLYFLLYQVCSLSIFPPRLCTLSVGTKSVLFVSVSSALSTMPIT